MQSVIFSFSQTFSLYSFQIENYKDVSFPWGRMEINKESGVGEHSGSESLKKEVVIQSKGKQLDLSSRVGGKDEDYPEEQFSKEI